MRLETTGTDRVLLALVANGGVVTEFDGIGDTATERARPATGGAFAPPIQARMLLLLEAGLIECGPGGRAALTFAGAAVLRAGPPSTLA